MTKSRIDLPEPVVTDETFNQLFKLDDTQKNTLSSYISSLNLNKNQSNTPPFPWDYVKAAMVFRKENYPGFREAMEEITRAFSDDKHNSQAQALVSSIESMKGKFIALFSANKIDPGSYHTYPHGVEMSADPGEFAKSYFDQNCGTRFEAELWRAMVDAIGAAHDIIQGKAPPINERESAAVYIHEMKKMLDAFMIENKENLTPGQITALEQFRDQAIPFLANECLINGTYLLFNSGKRDFANILHQVHEIVTPGKKEFNNGSELGDTKLAAAIMTVALSDTRRSEMTHVLDRQELLNSVPDHLIEPLEKVLRMTGLLNEGEHINDLRDRNDTQKLRDIEGFLLRVGQNIRMTTELAGVFKKPGASDRLSILEQGRVTPSEGFNVDVDTQNHLQPFLDSIGGPFGEAAFAKALGEIDQKELLALAEAQGISDLVNTDTLDLSGWQNHAVLLENLQTACARLKDNPDDLKNVAQVLIFIASKPPGHHVSPEIHQAMQKELQALKQEISTVKWGPDNGDKDKQMESLEKKKTCLEKDIREIEKANPHLTASKRKAQEMIADESRSHTLNSRQTY